jgi:hypothetical protein
MQSVQKTDIACLTKRLKEINAEIHLIKHILWVIDVEKGNKCMVELPLTKEQFKAFQEALEKEQGTDPQKNVQIWVKSTSETGSGGFGFTFDPFITENEHK